MLVLLYCCVYVVVSFSSLLLSSLSRKLTQLFTSDLKIKKMVSWTFCFNLVSSGELFHLNVIVICVFKSTDVVIQAPLQFTLK